MNKGKAGLVTELQARMMQPSWVIFVLATAWPGTSLADELARNINQIFLHQHFAVNAPKSLQWQRSGAEYTVMERSSDAGDSNDIVRYDTVTGERRVLVSGEKLRSSDGSGIGEIEGYSVSSDGRWLLLFTDAKRVWRKKTRGNYWALEMRTGGLRRIGGKFPGGTLMYGALSPDCARVAYVQQGNLYVETLASGDVTQLTHDGSSQILNGVADWVNEEELEIYDAYAWSPDGRNIAYWQFDTRLVGKFPLLDHMDGIYPGVREIAWPKAGTTNSAVRIGVVPVTGGATQWIRAASDLRNHYVAKIEWLPDSKEIVLQQLDRPQKRNDVLVADVASGETTEVFRDTDDAWVSAFEPMLTSADGAFLYVLRDRGGWRRMEQVSRSTKSAVTLTPDGMDVIGVTAIDRRGDWLYFTASPENATQTYLYRAAAKRPGVVQRVTPGDMPGTHSYSVSPDGKWAVHTYSAHDRVPVTTLINLPEHRVVRTLERNQLLRGRVAQVLQPMEFFRVRLRNGVSLDGWMIRPRDFDARKKYPVVVYVYGGPMYSTVTDGWGSAQASARMLFHHALSSVGIIVVSIDNRGTPAPKGREWRKAMWGALDVTTVEEQPEALKALLQERAYMDSSRVGVWGWSSGGSNTLSLMFRFSDLYRVGVSVAPMADHRYYDTIYTERYLGMPQDNPEGYTRASAITFADGLRGNLLLMHGAADDNTPIQGTQLLIDRLVALGKRFDFMEYPQGTHSLDTSREMIADVYRRIGRYFYEQLLSERHGLTVAPRAGREVRLDSLDNAQDGAVTQ